MDVGTIMPKSYDLLGKIFLVFCKICEVSIEPKQSYGRKYFNWAPIDIINCSAGQ